MTPGEFIEAFDTIAEAPGGIERLWELVLQLAVRGKLVPQDLGDEPASELLRCAKAAKIREMIERKIRRDSAPELSESAGEASSPTHWVWTHLYDFALVLGGKRLPAGASFSTEKTDNIYIRVTDMKNSSISTEDLRYISDDVQARIAKYTIDREDLYITIAGTIGDVGEVPEHFHGQNLTENAAKIVFREVDKRFLLLVLRSGDVKEQFQEKMKQMAQPKLALKRISGARIPIPPLAEQHRIAAKVDELMGLIDRLAAARSSREAVRTAGRDSTLAALRNAATAEEVGTAWTRIAEQMDDLFTASADLVPLREAVLQLAVRGRLVPQDADDEPAAVLLERIAEEKVRIIKSKRILKQKNREQLSHDDGISTRLPQGWCRTHAANIGSVIRGVTYQKAQASETLTDTSIALLRAHNIQWRVELGRLVYVPRNLVKENQFLHQGDLLFCIASGSSSLVGKSALIEEGLDATFGAFTAVLRPHNPAMSRFLALYCASPDGRTLLVSYSQGIGIKNLKTTALAALPISVPPLSEQHRIVAKVDELMELIDRLEQHIGAKEEAHTAFAAATNVV